MRDERSFVRERLREIADDVKVVHQVAGNVQMMTERLEGHIHRLDRTEGRVDALEKDVQQLVRAATRAEGRLSVRKNMLFFVITGLISISSAVVGSLLTPTADVRVQGVSIEAPRDSTGVTR